MPTRDFSIRVPGLIACEKADDQAFLTQMLVALRISEIDVKQVEGVSGFPTFIRGLRPATGFYRLKAFAVVRDADQSAAGAFASVGNFLRASGFPVPASPATFAVASPASADPMVGVFVMPDGTTHGALEDLCLRAVAETTGGPELACMREFLDCVSSQGGPDLETSGSRQGEPQRLAGVASRSHLHATRGHQGRHSSA